MMSGCLKFGSQVNSFPVFTCAEKQIFLLGLRFVQSVPL